MEIPKEKLESKGKLGHRARALIRLMRREDKDERKLREIKILQSKI